MLRPLLLFLVLSVPLLSAAKAEEVFDLTGPVLLLSDAPRQLREACPGLAGAGGECRIEQVIVRPEAAGWKAEAILSLTQADGSRQPMTLSARLHPESCQLVERQVTPDNARARRLLTLTERQLARARRDRSGMQAFCLMAPGLIEGSAVPTCLCP
ncbi:MAG: hypothetical protein AAFY02_19740 [Pseudomonadota bacterium]